MSKIRSKNTFGERAVKKALRGLYFRQHPKITGNPDFGTKKFKIAIFVDGCYWHKCPKCYVEAKSNKSYWLPKIEQNVQRDKKINKTLKEEKWIVMRVWEHELKEDPKKTIIALRTKLEKLMKISKSVMLL